MVTNQHNTCNVSCCINLTERWMKIEKEFIESMLHYQIAFHHNNFPRGPCSCKHFTTWHYSCNGELSYDV